MNPGLRFRLGPVREAIVVFDALVVGGGIVGATTAYYLSLKGQRVGIVEKNQLGQGTTARNFSWINGTSKTSNEAYHRLNALGVQMYGYLAGEFGAETMGLNPVGSLGYAPRSDAVAFNALKEQEKALLALDYPCQWVDTGVLRDLEPNMSFSDECEGLLAEVDKSLDATKFTRLMADQVVARGGAVFENCAARELMADDDGVVSGIVSDQGELAANAVIVAAGPDTPAVLAGLTGFDGFASRFPVLKVPGLLVTTPPTPEGLVRHLVYTDTGGEFHVFPDFSGGLRISSDDADGAIIDDQSEEKLRTLAIGLLKRMNALLPDFPGEELIDDCNLSVGIRAYPEDGLSIAGALPGADGLYVIATHSGITLAPALGKLMAELVVSGQCPDALKPFGLERLAGFG